MGEVPMYTITIWILIVTKRSEQVSRGTGANQRRSKRAGDSSSMAAVNVTAQPISRRESGHRRHSTIVLRLTPGEWRRCFRRHLILIVAKRKMETKQVASLCNWRAPTITLYGHTSGTEDGSTDSDENDCEIWFDVWQGGDGDDGDGLTWWEEVKNRAPAQPAYGTDPTEWDTDEDGICDREALYYPYFDPLLWDDPNTDNDGDGFTEAEEINIMLTDPLGWERKALIVVGSGDWAENLQGAFDSSADLAYNVLKRQGYSDEDIILLSPHAERDSDSDGDNDVDFKSTKSNVERAIAKLDGDDQILLHFIDHGDINNGFYIGGEWIDGPEMANWIDNINFKLLITILDCCHSGAFIDDIGITSDNNKIILASSVPPQVSWTYNDRSGCIFSDGFFTGIDNGDTICEAFLAAGQETMLFAGTLTNPCIDDNGDGIYTWYDQTGILIGDDGDLAMATML